MRERLYRIKNGVLTPVFNMRGTLIGVAGESIKQIKLYDGATIQEIDSQLRKEIGTYTLINMGKQKSDTLYETMMDKLEVKVILPKVLPMHGEQFESKIR